MNGAFLSLSVMHCSANKPQVSKGLWNSFLQVSVIVEALAALLAEPASVDHLP